MQKRAIIIHGWEGYPEEGWFPWLKQELEERGFNVQVPAMPHPERPTIDDWVTKLANVVGVLDEQTYLIGHSIGCQTILRYLETLPETLVIGPIIFVAPFLELLTLDGEEDPIIAKPWLETPINYDRIKARTKRIIAIFSDTDRYVPLANVALFADRLGAETRVLHERNHFSGSEGTTAIPEIIAYFN